MNSLVVFAVVIATTVSKPTEQLVSLTQDALGNYNLKYAIEGISRTENRDIHGNVNGDFSYIDPHGVLRKTEYTAGIDGFQAVGSDIPLPIPDTPEVAHAKAEHLAVLRAAELAPKIPEFQDATPQVIEVAAGPVVKSVPDVIVPVASVPITDVAHVGIPETPEVAAARAEHLAAHAAARANLIIH